MASGDDTWRCRLAEARFSRLAHGHVTEESKKEPAKPERPSRMPRFLMPMASKICRESVYLPLLNEQLALRPGMRVLELGSRDGTIAIELAKSEPAASVVALEPDETSLIEARRRGEAEGVFIEWVGTLPTAAGFLEASFDRILSVRFFHRLDPALKWETLDRLHALLKPGGELHLVDWGKPENFAYRIGFLGVQLVEGMERTQDHLEGNLSALLRAAGFKDVEKTHTIGTAFGTLELMKGRRGS